MNGEIPKALKKQKCSEVKNKNKKRIGNVAERRREEGGWGAVPKTHNGTKNCTFLIRLGRM